MKFSHLALTAALLLSSAAIADTALAADAPAAAGDHAGMRGFLSPEERMMLFADAAKATAGMTDDQKKAYREKRRADFMALSDADKAKMKADLGTRWAALPADQKSAITAKFEAWRAARQAGGGQ